MSAPKLTAAQRRAALKPLVAWLAERELKSRTDDVTDEFRHGLNAAYATALKKARLVRDGAS